jgi:hypothetical protein
VTVLGVNPDLSLKQAGEVIPTHEMNECFPSCAYYGRDPNDFIYEPVKEGDRLHPLPPRIRPRQSVEDSEE